MESITELKKKLRKGEMTFDEVLNTVYGSIPYRYRYTVSLINDKGLNKKIIGERERDKLFKVLLENGNECIKFLNRHGCEDRYREKLLDEAMRMGTREVLALIYNDEYIKYILKNIRNTDRLYNSYTLNQISMRLKREKDENFKKELVECLISNKDLVLELMTWYNTINSFSEEEKQRIYDEYKEDIFSNRLGINRLYSGVSLLGEFMEFKYVDRVVDKIIRINDKEHMYKLNEIIEATNLTEDEREALEAKIMLYKLTG